MKFWFPTIFWPPKMGGRYLKMPFLATRWPKMNKRRVHCFLELLKIKRWTRKKNWFLTFLTHPPKTPFFDQKTPFLATRGPKLKKPRAHSYVHFIYEDIVWYEILSFDTFSFHPMTPQTYKKKTILDASIPYGPPCEGLNHSGGCIFVSINLIKPILASGWCFGPVLAGDIPNRGFLGLKLGF